MKPHDFTSYFKEMIFQFCVLYLVFYGFTKSCIKFVQYYYATNIQHTIRVSSRAHCNSDETVCAICLENLSSNDIARIAYCNCRLRYHFKCIVEWTNKRGSCPQCRQKHSSIESITFIEELMIQFEGVLNANNYGRRIIIGCSLYILIHFVLRTF